MGHTAQNVLKRQEDVQRKDRLEKRRKLHNPEVNFQSRDSAEENNEPTEHEAKKVTELEQKVDNSPFGLIGANEAKSKYYTGFPYNFINDVIFKNIEDFKDLGYRFHISPTTVSTYFENIIHILYKRFSTLIRWPDRITSKLNIPECFREVFHDKTTVIIDCFEVFIEKPSSLLTQQQCWSNYKHHHTVKFLIGITPQGSICYISDAWGGRASDKQIVEGSHFCNKIKPGDIVLADRGFLIRDILGMFRAKLVIPAFTKGKSQLHPIEVEETRQIAHVRIHVERVTGLVKNKFRIFRGTIPISMLKKGSISEQHNMLDKIVIVSCALINLSPPIIPL
nr:unnamed protein product [Callosobruchus chinensis]